MALQRTAGHYNLHTSRRSAVCLLPSAFMASSTSTSDVKLVICPESDDTSDADVLMTQKTVRCVYCNMHIGAGFHSCNECDSAICLTCVSDNRIHGLLVPRADHALVASVASNLMKTALGQYTATCKCTLSEEIERRGLSDGCVVCYYKRYTVDRAAFLKLQTEYMIAINSLFVMRPWEWAQIDSSITDRSMSYHCETTYYLMSRGAQTANVCRIVYDYTGFEWHFTRLRYQIFRAFLSRCEEARLEPVLHPKTGIITDPRVLAPPS